MFALTVHQHYLTVGIDHRSQKFPGAATAVHPQHAQDLQKAQTPDGRGGKNIPLGASCQHWHWRNQHHHVYMRTQEQTNTHTHARTLMGRPSTTTKQLLLWGREGCRIFCAPANYVFINSLQSTCLALQRRIAKQTCQTLIDDGPLSNSLSDAPQICHQWQSVFAPIFPLFYIFVSRLWINY